MLQVKTPRVRPHHPKPLPGGTVSVMGSSDLGLNPDSLPSSDSGDSPSLFPHFTDCG